ncbi:MAG: 23S rRNA (guanosine(2251)-2'-O)-methyltransferase RlmB [Proteobacteria bacterium]|jgi:23S rRNA (guanosine2251-2'-O)-methyltransferase|nr:23S rRNA (guanosine(2251)-2'-O)-methyltransferase RlmB [Pseudomonadota bacterium]
MITVIHGKHSVLLACTKRNSDDITKILLSDANNITLFPKHLQEKIVVSPQSVLNKITQGHNGFVCYTKPIRTIPEKDIVLMKNIIALDGVQDVGNIGAILRSAAAFNVDAVIYTNDKMPDLSTNPSISKFSSGGVELVKLCQVVNLHRTLQNLQKENFWIIGTDANGEDVSQISRQYMTSKKVVVFGNEETGVRASIRKSCDVFASIKVNPSIDSLNVSAAAAIVMWEMFGKS